MPTSTILLTGATGLIGFHVLLDLLQADYIVKAVVRSTEKSKPLLEHEKIQAAHKDGHLTFLTIPDFAIPGIWDEPLQGVEYFLHVASQIPYPDLDPEKDIYYPTVRSNENLFKAISAAPNLKRVILTSSTVASIPPPPRASGPYSAASVQVSAPTPPFTNVMDAYQSAKIQERNASHALIKENPRFDVINILPGYVFGRDQRAKTAAALPTSSNALIVWLLTGATLPARDGLAAHLDDVVKLHIKALDPSTSGNKDYGVSVPMVYNDAIVFAKKRFPEAFEDGRLVAGDHPSEAVQWDATPTEAEFGIKFKDWETQVVDVISQYLELLANEKKE